MEDTVVCRRCGNRILDGIICYLCEQEKLYIEAEKEARSKFIEHNAKLLGDILEHNSTISENGIDLKTSEKLVDPELMTKLDKEVKRYLDDKT